MPSPSRTQLGFLNVTWNGQSLAVVEDKIQDAQSHEQNGELEDAERRYREALATLENLLSPTHDDTNMVGYHLASFYATHDRMDEADSVLNWMTKKHVQRWGFLHSKTHSHFLHILDMLKDWSRGDTAMAFAYRVLDRWDQNIDDLPRVSGNQKDPTVAIDLISDNKDLDDALAEIDDPARADYQVEIATTRAERNDGSAEGLFLRLAEQCQKYPTKLEMHTLKIKASLVRLYQQREDESQIGVALGEVRDAIHAILASSSEKTEGMMEVCIDVIALCFKDEDQQNAKDLYQNVANKAEDVFGSDDDVIIGLLIRIGNIYQNENQWSNAQPWFERALSASMSASLHSTMTKRLEKALENKRYSVETLTYRDIEHCVRLRGLRSYLGNKIDFRGYT
jgi:tetratricopeptide (TPR) repeat protein